MMRVSPRFYGIWLLFTLLLLGAGTPAPAASPAAQALRTADDCRKSLLASAPKRKYRHNWERCIRAYERIARKYPRQDESAWALYHAAGLFRDLYPYSGRAGDLDEAVRLYDELCLRFEDHRLADDAQFLKASLLLDKNDDPLAAYLEFLKVEIRYPSGDMVPRARKILDGLACTVDRHPEREAPRAEASPAGDSGLTNVKGIRYWSAKDYTRVVIDAEGPVKYGQQVLEADTRNDKPRRLYIDLEKARISNQIDEAIPIRGDLLQQARAGQFTPDTVRVVLDIQSIGAYEVFHLADPFRIVVDVRREKIEGAPHVAPPALAAPDPESIRKRLRKGVRRADEPDGKVSLARQLGLNVKRIVIDPGHGGEDPGCIAARGVKEKDIVLNLALALQKELEKQIGCEVLLTRNKDVYVPLERRTAIANMQRADLFISLHVNAHRNPRIKGIETYFLNMATDERAMMVAARENAASEKSISDLQTILSDLMMNTKINESSRLAHQVQSGLLAAGERRYRSFSSLGVKQAPFYVLIGAQMPAVLVEVGFLTNSTERQRLLSKDYQRVVAEGISQGTKAYIQSIGGSFAGGG